MGGCGLSGPPHVVAGSHHDSGGPSGDTWGVCQFVSMRPVLFLKCVIRNCRNCELFLVCATYMYDSI